MDVASVSMSDFKSISNGKSSGWISKKSNSVFVSACYINVSSVVEDGCGPTLLPVGPLLEKTVVYPLLWVVGFKLFPALISASSSELSPVGDIMLKDFAPADKRIEQKSETR